MKPPRKKWLLWTAATCLCLVLVGALLLPKLRSTGPNGLPLLEVSLDGGTGVEGLLCFDFSQLDNGNPWREDMALDTLPVFHAAPPIQQGIPIFYCPLTRRRRPFGSWNSGPPPLPRPWEQKTFV